MSVFLQRKRYPMTLPPYIKIEYIQSDGGQYINTEYKPKSTTKVIIDAQWDDYEAEVAISRTPIQCLFGCANKYYYFGMMDPLDSRALVYYYYGKTNANTWNIQAGRHVYTADGPTGTVYNLKQTYTDQTAFEVTEDLYIFAYNFRGTVSSISKGKIWCAKIYDNGQLIRDYIPVQLTADGSVGLWDLVENRFYGNIGTGYFTAGGIAA